MADLYDSDFYAWATRQAALLRQQDLDAVDFDHIAEEIEALGRSERREAINRLAVLMAHLLTWRLQPGGRGTSWRATIREHRLQLARLFADNPSLRAILVQLTDGAWPQAVLIAVRETMLEDSHFPANCPWEAETILDDGYWPS